MVKQMTVNEMNTTIGRIKAAGGVLQARIHAVAVSTLAHIRDHGDTTIAARLLDALPNGQRVKALAHWYSHFSKGMAVFSIDKKTKQWVCKLSDKRVVTDFDIDAASATNFADLTTEKSPETMTVEALDKWLSRVASNNDMFPGTSIPKVETKAQVIASELVAVLRAKRAERAAA
jgi:hypothetical protein